MITLQQALDNVGNKVIYQPRPDARPEEGVITSVALHSGYVRVRYGSDTLSKSTRPEDLEFLTAVVSRPDSAAHFLCPVPNAPAGATHHLVPTGVLGASLRCRYCRRTEKQIREDNGL